MLCYRWPEFRDPERAWYCAGKFGCDRKRCCGPCPPENPWHGKIQESSVWAQHQIKRAVELGLGVHGREKITIKVSGVEEIKEILANLA